MNLIEFNKILSKPTRIRKDQIKELQLLLEKYPYFNVGHFLLLNGLKKRRSFNYNDYLKKMAAYTQDRSLLFEYISELDSDFNPAPEDIGSEEIEVDGEKAPADTMEPPKVDDDPQITLEKEIPTKQRTDKESAQEQLKLGQPLVFNKTESYSFMQWLQLGKMEPIERASSDQLVEKGPLKNMDLIDKFISDNPKIKPVTSSNFQDVAAESIEENEQLMTETLAHVYLEQKKYDKAMTAFTVLSLKYPEKSSFFASQIEAIKKIQEKK